MCTWSKKTKSQDLSLKAQGINPNVAGLRWILGCLPLIFSSYSGHIDARGMQYDCPDIANIAHWDWGNSSNADTASLKVLSSSERYLINASGSFRLSGKCARDFSGFKINGNSDLNARSISEGAQPGGSRWRQLNFVERVDSSYYPKRKGVQFVMGARMNLRNPADFVGVWREKSRWNVYHYQRSVTGVFTPLEPLFQSETPIEAISFIPFLHNDYGYLYIAQSTNRPNELILQRVYWSHVFTRRPTYGQIP